MKKLSLFVLILFVGTILTGCAEKKARTKDGAELTVDEVSNGGAFMSAANQVVREQREAERR